MLLFYYWQDVVTERDKLAKQLPELQQQLETELLARTDLENRNMKDLMDFRTELDMEISAYRKLVERMSFIFEGEDKTAKEKTRLQLDAGRSRAELGELTPK